MNTPGWIIALIYIADIALRIGLSMRVVLSRRPVGTSLAWLFVILLLPFVGAAIYLLIGELRLGKQRQENWRRLEGEYRIWMEGLRARRVVDWSKLAGSSKAMANLTSASAGTAALPGNRLELLEDWESAFDSILAGIDGARRSCYLEFYIWHRGGRVDEVVEALLRAAKRGIDCRLLLDAIGSRRFLKSDAAAKLKQGGVRVVGALPGGLFHAVVKRFDLRAHRKLIVIDGETAYTGSMNMADPRYFGLRHNVGEWIDAVVRLSGPAVEAMAAVFSVDWAVELGDAAHSELSFQQRQGHADAGPAVVQVVSTGATMGGDATRIVLSAIYSARRELKITTPYFVADEAIVTALVSAAQRGVRVTVIYPRRVDSLLVRLASQPHLGALLAAGVKLMLFDDGLLHTKSILVDDEISLFGSLNIDPRSLHLNFELTLVVYDRGFAADLNALQCAYLRRSSELALADWQGRSLPRRLIDNIARLLSPLL